MGLIKGSDEHLDMKLNIFHTMKSKYDTLHESV